MNARKVNDVFWEYFKKKNDKFISNKIIKVDNINGQHNIKYFKSVSSYGMR